MWQIYGELKMTTIKAKNIFSVILFVSFVIASAAAKRKEIQKGASQLLEKEVQKINGATCKSTNFPSIQQLHYSNKVDQAIVCLLKSLSATNLNGWNWSYLGSLYSEKGEKTKATTCFKQATKLIGKVSQFVNHWHFIGPFVIGKSEVDGDPLEFLGGIRNVSRHRHDRKAAFYSELAAGGVIKWKTYSQTKAGERVQIAPDINWNDLISSLGSLAITEWQGWVVGEFAVNSKGDISVQCLGVHTFFLDGVFIAADVYRRDEFWFTIPLDVGIHTIFIRLRAKGSQVFSCNIRAADGDPFLVHPATNVPDIVEDTLMGDVFTIPLTNLQGNKWLKSVKVSLAEPSEVTIGAFRERGLMNVAPGQTIPIIIRLALDRNQDGLEIHEGACRGISFKLKVSATGVKETQVLPVKIRCRKRHESFIFSFLDHDGSVQHAAAIEPLEDCPVGQCPVLLTLHGTGVEAQNQADGYKRMEDESWFFGLERAWVLAPTRHGAHNWEGPGTLTSMTALQRLHQMMSEIAWMPNKPLTDQVIFAGHSMGGHGAWHLATHYPDRALAVVSLAGWIKKEEYGDSNVFFRHDISTSHTDSATKHILEACIAENDADRHISNLQGLPVLTRIGAIDRTVHPFFVRRMNRLLKEQGINVTYTELAGKEHWWWDTWKTNDGGAVNDPKLRHFTNEHAKLSPSLLRSANLQCDVGEGEGKCTSPSSENKYSRSASGSEGDETEMVTLTVVNPALGEGLRGVKVVQQLVPFRTSTIKMALSNGKAELTTRNVERFSITALGHIPYNWRNISSLKIDGILLNTDEEHGMMVKENATHFCKTDAGSWLVCTDDALKDDERDYATYGPARRVAEREFLIVTGTASDKSSATLLHLAVYLANLFFLTSDTVATVIEDASLTVEMAASHNLIIIGGPGHNAWAQQFIERLPQLSISENGLSLGRCQFSDPRTGALFLAPQRKGLLALVLMGNSLQGLEDIMRLASPTIPPMTRSPFSNMVPDYVITGPDFRAKGPGGYECAGFWGNRWDYRLETSSCVC
nr:uncharacterized protein LOC129264279 [Lytechinus pictus]